MVIKLTLILEGKTLRSHAISARSVSAVAQQPVLATAIAGTFSISTQLPRLCHLSGGRRLETPPRDPISAFKLLAFYQTSIAGTISISISQE